MKQKLAINLLDSRFRIFGTMDGFALVKWTVKIENPLHIDVFCRLAFDFLDYHGKIVEACEGWQWFCDVYSQKRHPPMDRGHRHLIQSGAIVEVSGVVKTSAQEAGSFAGIDVRIDPITQTQ